MQVNNVTLTGMENRLTNSQEEIVCAIDIGTSKVAALVGKRNQYGKIEVLGIGNCPSFGVQRGVVVNIARTVESIKKAVMDAERQSGVKFKRVHVGIAGQHIKSLQHRGILTRNNNDTWITNEDIQKLKNEMHKLALPPGDRILHVLPQEYIVDNEPGIIHEPIGMMGVRLEGNFHIITGAETAIRNIESCITIAGLEVASIELEPLASADAVLTRDELEAGVCLVDIGGGTTDIAIFENFIIRHTAVIPFGGNIITEDLKDFRILRNQAELLKVNYGSAIPYEELRSKHVSIQGEGTRAIGNREVNLLSVSKVISARMREILAHVAYQINLSGYSKKLIGGIVLTGGGSQMKHLTQLTEMEVGQDARLGLPKVHLATTKVPETDNPIYATGIGLLIRAFKLMDDNALQHAQEQVAPAKEEIKLQEEAISTPVVEDKVVNIDQEIISTSAPDFEEEREEEMVTQTQRKQGESGKISLVSSWSKKITKWIQSDIEDFSDSK
jgi:cell division protein FtsA